MGPCGEYRVRDCMLRQRLQVGGQEESDFLGTSGILEELINAQGCLGP